MSDVSSTTSTPSGMTGAGGGNMLRITGMASGLDVDAMVKKMMMAEQTKIDKAKQAQQTIQWKQDAYQDIIKDVKDLQSTYFNSLMPDTNVLSSSNYAAFDAKVTDATMLSATAGVGSQIGTYKIDFSVAANQAVTGAGKPGQLAEEAAVNGISLASGTSLSTTLQTLGLAGSSTFTINYNGTSKTITVNKTDKLSDVINNISNATSSKVTASFSELTGKFTIQSANTGSTQKLTISSSSGTILTNLGMAASDGVEADGKDAVVTITPPGAATGTTITRSSNNFTIDGITYNLQNIKTSDDTSYSTTFSVTQDSQKVYDKIKGFIDKYNAIVDKIQTKLTEKKSSDYAPLTDTQKASMSASQISAWEDKAKVGILRNDDNLQSMLTSLRSAFTTAVSNTGLSFGQYGSNSIGLDTSDDITQGGKIIIEDATKLKNAISQHGDQILKMFTNVSTSTDKTTQFNENGIFQRINNIFVNNVGYTGTVLNNAVLTKYANYQDNYSNYGGAGNNTLPDQLYQQTQLLKNLNTEYSTKQEAYYQQFSALETALTTLNAQQSQLSSMLG